MSYFREIEVSDTTVEFDCTVKAPLYAQNKIAEVWIVDLSAQAIQVYRDPSAEGYRKVEKFGRGTAIAFQAFTDIQFTVNQLVG